MTYSDEPLGVFNFHGWARVPAARALEAVAAFGLTGAFGLAGAALADALGLTGALGLAAAFGVDLALAAGLATLFEAVLDFAFMVSPSRDRLRMLNPSIRGRTSP
jgi:hypothetical protein